MMKIRTVMACRRLLRATSGGRTLWMIRESGEGGAWVRWAWLARLAAWLLNRALGCRYVAQDSLFLPLAGIKGWPRCVYQAERRAEMIAAARSGSRAPEVTALVLALVAASAAAFFFATALAL